MSSRFASVANSSGLVAQANLLLPGLYAWSVTVAIPVRREPASPLAHGFAAAALVALLGSVLGLRRDLRVARGFGIFGVPGLSLATWVVLSLSVVRRPWWDPLLGWLGGLGWVLYALGWGTACQARDQTDSGATVQRALPARGRLPWGAAPVLAVGVTGGLAALGFGWASVSRAHGLLAQAVALLSAVALTQVAALVAVRLGTASDSARPAVRIRAAAGPLLVLGLLLLVGLLRLR